MPEFSDKQNEQMKWVDSHRVEDKDSRPAPAEKRSRKREKPGGKPSKGHHALEMDTDMEIDLHGLAIDEAMARVEQAMEALKKSGHSTLRIVHGVGRNSPNSIAWKLHNNLESIWKSRLARHFHENKNLGATVVVLK